MSGLHSVFFTVRDRTLALRDVALIFTFTLSIFISTQAEAACTAPNSISNGQVADATAVVGNFNALNDCANSTNGKWQCPSFR